MPKIERPAVPPPKTCIACARPFTWRKKWERDWEHVKYCSDACRRRGPQDRVGDDASGATRGVRRTR
ncbi:MAG: DUF2256 domain-containing protein [Planctomycetaceae bacterium]|nr:DUF2256 domain-containing protein [Planctomycetaceae bacterium]